jgi:hypothetical protein
MANYYTQFSFAVDFDTPERAAKVIRFFEMIGQDEVALTDDAELNAIITTSKTAMGDDFGYSMGCEVELLPAKADDDGQLKPQTEVWFQDPSGEGSIGSLSEVLAIILSVFDMDRGIEFTYAETCSKPRFDAFGGGAIRVTKDGMVGINTADAFGDKGLIELLDASKFDDVSCTPDVWVLSIEHKQGANVSVHRSSAAANKELLDYVRQSWHERFNDDDLMDEHDNPVEDYFNDAVGNEGYEIERTTLLS